LQLQILRIGFFLQIIGYLYFAGYLAKRLQNGSLKGLAGAVVTLAFVTHVSSLIPLLFLLAYQWLARARWRQGLAFSGIILIQLATVYTSVVSGYWSPRIVVFEPETSWTQAQDWARENTAKDAMFITPPQLFFSYVPDWRTFSERGTLATLVEVFEFPHPDYFPGWQTKFDAIAPMAIQKFNGNYFDTMKITRDAYYSLKPEDLIKISNQYAVRYLVIEKPHLQPFPIAYENDGFVIYDMKQ
jgi:hypothetical protein